MELKLNSKSIEYMGNVFRSSFTHEVTTESIIPDSLPDAERIIGTDAMVYIRSKEPEAGRLTIGGVVEVNVIYSDDEGRIRRTQISRQFGTSVDNSGISQDTKALVTMGIASADTRLLNPRKMLVRCDVLLNVECYEPRRVELRLSPEDNTYPVEILSDKREALLLTDMAEKTFSVTEDYALPSGKPAVGEILGTYVSTALDDISSTGGKAMLKGTIRARLIYRPERGGMPETIEFSTAFSQIMEPGGEGTEFRAVLVPTAVYLGTESLLDSDDRRLTLEVSALAQCLAYRKETLSFITDAYSCSFDIKTETGEAVIDPAGTNSSAVGSLREVIETSREATGIIGVSAYPGVVYENGGELQSTVTVSVLYMSEDGVLLSATKKLNAEAEMPANQEGNISVTAAVQGEPTAVVAAEGIEVKLNVAFAVNSACPMTVTGLTSIDIDTDSPRDLSRMPSLVLRRFSDGDTLWTLAKKYNSVRSLIAGANGLEEGAEPKAGSMLIIPKKR